MNLKRYSEFSLSDGNYTIAFAANLSLVAEALTGSNVANAAALKAVTDPTKASTFFIQKIIGGGLGRGRYISTIGSDVSPALNWGTAFPSSLVRIYDEILLGLPQNNLNDPDSVHPGFVKWELHAYGPNFNTITFFHPGSPPPGLQLSANENGSVYLEKAGAIDSKYQEMVLTPVARPT